MNWYKIAKQQFEEYWEIGHTPGNTILWIYLNGKVLAKPCDKGDAVHSDFWPNMQNEDYRGRYEKSTKLCSLMNFQEGRPIPNPILRGLYDKFGNDIKIVEF